MELTIPCLFCGTTVLFKGIETIPKNIESVVHRNNCPNCKAELTLKAKK